MKIIGFSSPLVFLSLAALGLQSLSVRWKLTVLLSWQFGLFGNWSLLVW